MRRQLTPTRHHICRHLSLGLASLQMNNCCLLAIQSRLFCDRRPKRLTLSSNRSHGGKCFLFLEKTKIYKNANKLSGELLINKDVTSSWKLPGPLLSTKARKVLMLMHPSYPHRICHLLCVFWVDSLHVYTFPQIVSSLQTGHVLLRFVSPVLWKVEWGLPRDIPGPNPQNLWMLPCRQTWLS